MRENSQIETEAVTGFIHHDAHLALSICVKNQMAVLPTAQTWLSVTFSYSAI